MKRFDLLIVVFSCLVTSVNAQQSPIIRSGEHETFTRITIPVDSENEWSIQPEQESVLVSFSESIPEITTSAVFERIGRMRIRDIELTEDRKGILIHLNCNCGFKAFMANKELLVVDVSQEFPRTFLKNLKPPGNVSTVTDLNSPSIPLFFDGLPGFLLYGRDMSDSVNRDVEEVPEIAASGSVETFNFSETSLSVEQSILSEIDKAQLSGRLEAAQKRTLYPVKGDLWRQLDLRNATTKDLSMQNVEATNHALANQAEKSCAPDEFYDVGSWGHQGGYVSGLAEISSALYDEVGDLSQSTVLTLARHQIYFGFGAEALMTLALTVDPDAETDALEEIAKTLESQGQIDTDEINLEICSAPELLWRFLGALSLSPHQSEDKINNLRLEFDKLPQHLRPYLKESMEPNRSKLLESGQLLSSNSFANLEEPNHYQEGLESTEINQMPSTVSLIELVDAHVSKGLIVDSSVVERLGILFFEERRGPGAESIAGAYILALAFAGRFDEAFGVLSSRDYLRLENDFSGVLSKVYERLASHGEDEIFLKYVLNKDGKELTSDAENAIAERLISLGLVERANYFLKGDSFPTDDVKRSLLRSKAALSDKKFLEAYSALLSIKVPDARLLRDEAKLRIRNATLLPVEISPVLSENLVENSDISEPLELTSQQASSWPQRSSEVSMEELNTSRETDVQTQGGLQRVRDLLDDSEEMRGALAESLSGFTLIYSD